MLIFYYHRFNGYKNRFSQAIFAAHNPALTIINMRFIAIIICLLLSANVIAAQDVNPVRWTFKANKISEAEYHLVFTASIDRGWWIFSQYLEEGGPWPTALNFELSSDYELINLTGETGKKTEGYDPLFGVNTIKYTGSMTLSQKVSITESLQEINGFIEFMACNNEGCLPAKQTDFTFSFLE